MNGCGLRVRRRIRERDAGASRPAWPRRCGPGARSGRSGFRYDLRHAALSLWLASGAPAAEIAARAGHSVRVLLTIYATAYPAATRSPASTSSKPSAPATGPRLAHKNRRRRQESRPSCVRATAGPSGTQLDPGPPPRSG